MGEPLSGELLSSGDHETRHRQIQHRPWVTCGY
jgi:hypothetical protein